MEREWREFAACRGTDPEVFFPLDETNPALTAPARRVCAGCPVAVECLTDVLVTDRAPHVGIRGGMTGPERDELIATDVGTLLARHRLTAHERQPKSKAKRSHGQGPKPMRAGFGICRGCETTQPLGCPGDVRVLTHYVKGHRCMGSRRSPSERVDA